MSRLAITMSGPFSPTAGGEVTGVLFIATDGWAFPEVNWRDFVSVVPLWWIEGIRELGEGPDASATLSFMDGPYEIRCERRMERLRLEFVVCRVGGVVVERTLHVDHAEFAKPVIEACERLAAELAAAGYAAQAKRIARAASRRSL